VLSGELDCYTIAEREAGGLTQLFYFGFEGGVFLYEAGSVGWRHGVRRLLGEVRVVGRCKEAHRWIV
jgi:hypothetical protein